MSSDEARRSGGRRFLRLLLAAMLLAVLGGVAAMTAVYFTFLRDLPDLRTIEDYHPRLASVVVDRQGRTLGEFFEERRRLTPMQEIPRHVVQAFVAGEDKSFFEHGGIDFKSILRAAYVNLIGERKEGASTITQQMVKGLLLSPERTYRRKIREMILARRIEQHFSKEEILYLYLNQIYFGHGAYGIGEASRTYFGKEVSQLSVSEAALLAGLPKAPSRYSPFIAPERAERRRRYVLDRMLEDGYIDAATAAAAKDAPPQLAAGPWQPDYAAAAYFTEEVRRHLFDVLGGDAVLSGGLRIETTLDADLQQAAVTSLRAGLEELDHRQGYRGPLRKVDAKRIPEELGALAIENGLAPKPPEAGDVAAAPAEPSTEPAPTESAAQAAPVDADATPAERVQARFDAEGPLVGIVTSVDTAKQLANVAFAPDVTAEVHLKDVSWARPVDPERAPYEVSSIAEVFHRGDVAHFAPLPPEVPEEAPAPAKPAKPGEPEVVPSEPPLRATLAQTPKVQGALLSFEVATGEVLSFVGGYDFDQSEFDRVTQSRRQPGSAFKPIIYGAALSQEDAEGHKRYTPASIIFDRPKVYTDQYTGLVWKPKNYGREFYGPITFRKALAKSVNTAAVHLCDEVGIGEVIRYARRLGVESPIEPTLATALGTSGLSLLELTRSYAVFPSGGLRVVPRFIRRVTDRDGNVLLERVALGTDFQAVRKAAEATTPPTEVAEGEGAGATQDPANAPLPLNRAGIEQVIPPGDAYLMTDLLRAVVLEGTGQKLRALGRPVAGKTGTTNDQADAWFIGFSPDIVTGVWVGYDVADLLGSGETGARAAAPIWEGYMRAAMADRPVRDFSAPDSIVFARIDRESGLLATHLSKDTVFQSFIAGSEPTETADSQRTTSEGLQDLREDSLETDADSVRLMQLDTF